MKQTLTLRVNVTRKIHNYTIYGRRRFIIPSPFILCHYLHKPHSQESPRLNLLWWVFLWVFFGGVFQAAIKHSNFEPRAVMCSHVSSGVFNILLQIDKQESLIAPHSSEWLAPLVPVSPADVPTLPGANT